MAYSRFRVVSLIGRALYRSKNFIARVASIADVDRCTKVMDAGNGARRREKNSLLSSVSPTLSVIHSANQLDIPDMLPSLSWRARRKARAKGGAVRRVARRVRVDLSTLKGAGALTGRLGLCRERPHPRTHRSSPAHHLRGPSLSGAGALLPTAPAACVRQPDPARCPAPARPEPPLARSRLVLVRCCAACTPQHHSVGRGSPPIET